MLTHSQDFNDFSVRWGEGFAGLTRVHARLGMRKQKSRCCALLTPYFAASSTCPLEVHPPMSQRVYALTFLRST